MAGFHVLVLIYATFEEYNHALCRWFIIHVNSCHLIHIIIKNYCCHRIVYSSCKRIPAESTKEMEFGERSPLVGDKYHNNGSLAPTTFAQFKIYKRRWYVLFVFTAEALIYNMAWNTWAPIQEPCKIAFGWTDFDLLLLTSWAAISLILTSAPFTWLMDTKGWCF